MPEGSDYKNKRKQTMGPKTIPQVVSAAVTKLVGLERLPEGWVGGLDTDFYAGPFDHQLACLRGADFAYIRAGQQNIDSQFKNSWELSRNVYDRGPYWFLDKSISINRQARMLASLFPNGYDGELPVCLDMEQDTWFKLKGMPKRVHLNLSDGLAFRAVLKSELPMWSGRVTWYSNWSWWTTYGGLELNPGDDLFWYANPPPYGAVDQYKARYYPRVPAPWKRWDFLQISFAGDGRFYGTKEKGIDLNVWRGTIEQLRSL